jgi:hypothetical protein
MMFEHIEEKIQHTRPDLIGKYPHTKEYNRADFQMPRLLQRFRLQGRSAGNAYFTRLGFTDASICEIAGNASLVLTADLPLVNVLEHLGGHVINFNHIRALGW